MVVSSALSPQPKKPDRKAHAVGYFQTLKLSNFQTLKRKAVPTLDKDLLVPLLMTVGALLWIIDLWKRVFGKPKPISPQPLIVKMEEHFTPVTAHNKLAQEVKDGFGAVNAELHKLDQDRRESVNRAYKAAENANDKLRAEIREDISAMRVEMRGDLKGVTDRMSDVVESMGELRGEIKRMQS